MSSDFNITFSRGSNVWGSTFTAFETHAAFAATMVLYLVVVGLTWAIRPPHGTQTSSQFRTVRYAHNVALSLYSLAVAAATLWQTIVTAKPTSVQSFVCSAPNGWTYDVVITTWILSKMWEWIDTVLLVWNHKSLRFVHVWHHMTTVMLFAVGTTDPRMSKVGPLFNGMIHFVMYWHYASPFPARMRPWITRFQIVQFLCGLGCGTYIGFGNCGGTIDVAGYLLCTAIVVSYLLLFINFYVQAYCKKRKGA